MNNYTDIRVRYTHPAIPPVGIEVGKVYIVEHLVDNYKLDESAIKTLLTPVDTTWDKLEGKQTKKIKNKEVTKEELEIVYDGVE